MNTPFVLLQDDWIQIAPLGDHPHQLGIQRITTDGAEAMANRFNSFRSRLGRLFSGVPLFEGHHDTDPEKYPNGRSFAWVMELQNRAAEGLWAKMKWTDEGRDLVATGKYKFISPVWNAREIARENGRPVFIPETLLSLALTNLPNLPLPPLANAQSNMKKLTDILKLNDDATPDEICSAAEKLANQVTTHQSELATLQNTRDSLLVAHCSELKTAQEQFTNERTARIGLILENAVLHGRITAAERNQWQTDLTTAFDAKHAEIEALAPKLNTTSQTRDLGNDKNAYDTAAGRQAALTAFITEQMANGLSYDDAWAKAKTERAEIFANMKG